MGAYFLDSSALVKRFAGEKGTRWLLGLFRGKPLNAIFAARITFVEVTSALARKVPLGDISVDSEAKSASRLRRAFDYRISNVEIGEALVRSASRLARKHLLRGYDAIQLAAAIEIAVERKSIGLSELTLVSSDNDLNKAALLEGLTVEDPNNHP